MEEFNLFFEGNSEPQDIKILGLENESETYEVSIITEEIVNKMINIVNTDLAICQ